MVNETFYLNHFENEENIILKEKATLSFVKLKEETLEI